MNCLPVDGRYFNHSSGTLIILNCLFLRNTVYDGKGGSIFCNDVPLSMSITDTTIFQSSCTDDGGAIYFNSPISGESIIKRLCISDCSCGEGKSGSFGILNSGNLNKNYFEYISVNTISCYIPGKAIYHTLNINNGDIKMNSANFSNCYGYVAPIAVIETSNHLSIEYSNFDECDGFTYGLMITTFPSNLELSYLNFISNPISGLMFVNSSQLIMKMCFFDQNKGTLFNFKGNSVIFENCSVKHRTDKFISYGNASFTSKNVNLSTSNLGSTLNNYFYNTFFCECVIPDPTLQCTPEETQFPTKTLDPNNSNTNNKYLLQKIGGAALILVAIVVVGYLILNPNKKQPNDELQATL